MTANSVVNQIFQSESFVLQKGLNCPKPTIQGVGTPDGLSLYKPTIQGDWYTRRPFPVPNPRFKAVGTPDGLSLYQIHDSMQLVHQKAFSCTKSTIQGSWYTRKPFPVQTPRFKAVGTPESLFLYQTHDSRRWYTRRPSLYKLHDSRRLVHLMAFSCTKSTIQGSWYTKMPFHVPTPIIKLKNEQSS